MKILILKICHVICILGGYSGHVIKCKIKTKVRRLKSFLKLVLFPSLLNLDAVNTTHKSSVSGVFDTEGLPMFVVIYTAIGTPSKYVLHG